MKVSKSTLLKIVTLVVATTCTANVFAQRRGGGGFSGMMSGGGMTPDYMMRDLARFETALELTDEQTLIIEQILRDYDESFREASDASREGIGDAFRSMMGGEDDPARQQASDMRSRMGQLRDKLDSAGKLSNEEGMEDLQARLRKELDSLREEMQQSRVEQWQSPQRQAAFEDVSLYMQDQLRLKRKMRNEFEGDLVTILTEDQQDLWPPLQRQLIRDRLLPRGRLSGETIDVIGFIDQQEFEDVILTNLLPVLSDWDVNVTLALTARDDYMVENQGRLMTSMRTMDTNEGVDVMRNQARLAVAVRDTNDSAIDSIVFLLPEDQQTAFYTLAKERSYPRIYRVTRADRAFQSALEIEGLEPDILQGISELYEAFQLELEYVNQKIYDATHRWEAQEDLDRINRFSQRMTGGSTERAESPIREAENDRRDTEDQYIEQLRLFLTEEQIESIKSLVERPTRDRNSRGNANGQRGQGGGGFAGGREEFMKRFDKNGDGSIDDSERTSIRDYFRNGGGNGGGGGRGGNGGGGGRN